MAGNKNSGRKLDTLITNALRTAVNREADGGKKRAHKIAERMAKLASDGEDDRLALEAAKWIADRLEGKAKQTADVNVTSNPLKELYEQIVDRSKAGDPPRSAES